MLWTIFLVLLLMWLLGMVTGYVIGGSIYILLILAIASVAAQLINNRRMV